MVASSGLKCSVLSDPAQLEQLRPAWNALLQRSAANGPMLAPLWLLPWWQVYAQSGGRELKMGLFHDGDRLVGLAPLHWRRFWYRPGLPFRRLELLGADVDEGDGVGSDYLNVIAERGAEEAVAQALARALTAGVFGSWDEIVLPAMDGEGVMPSLLSAAFTRAGLATTCLVTGAAPYIPLPATWEAYLKRLTAKNRRFLLRSLEEFDAWAGESSSRHVTSRAELVEGQRILTALHGERWAAAGLTGVFQPRRRSAAFHDAVLPLLLDAGALELFWLAVRDEPVAVLYNIAWNGKVYFYQSGRKVDVPAGVRPGIVLQARAIRQAIQAGRREYDFLAGVAQYKLQLALATRPLVRVRAVRRSLREGARRLAERGMAWARAVRNAARSAVAWLHRPRRNGKAP
jgi:CelD/BcsL family acetyltransferase involved in cellulose biosynthesis